MTLSREQLVKINGEEAVLSMEATRAARQAEGNRPTHDTIVKALGEIADVAGVVHGGDSLTIRTGEHPVLSSDALENPDN